MIFLLWKLDLTCYKKSNVGGQKMKIILAILFEDDAVKLAGTVIHANRKHNSEDIKLGLKFRNF